MGGDMMTAHQLASCVSSDLKLSLNNAQWDALAKLIDHDDRDTMERRARAFYASGATAVLRAVAPSTR